MLALISGKMQAAFLRRYITGLTSLLIVAIVMWQPLHANQIAQDLHLGTATCATSQCHGKNSPQEDRNVQLNEYTIWIGGDRHSIAYKTLESKESKAIARKLGLPSATTAKICLDCHTDNVPQNKRGPKFQLSDGVGCEGCHGGAENWIASHTDPNTTHQQNIANGLLATEDTSVRAEVCLACHLGNKNQFATHRIMAAGHPRLSFELDLFTNNQPAHYSVDQDYIERKGRVDRVDLWVNGQLHSIEQSLQTARERLYDGEGIFPDFAFFDCHSCHHSMSQLRWSKTRADGVRPGSLRLNMPNMPVIESLVIATGNRQLASELTTARVNTVRAAQQGRRTFNASADVLLGKLDEVRSHLNSNIDRNDINTVLKSLLNAAAADQASDYAEAEQIYFSYETLCYAIGQIDQCESTLDKLFNAIDTDDKFDPSLFASVSKRLGGKSSARQVPKIESNKGRLTIITTPAEARVRIMNIKPRYTDGIELNIGSQYDIEVSEDGYETYRKMLTLTEVNQTLTIDLPKK